jgi:hypothetical protein
MDRKTRELRAFAEVRLTEFKKLWNAYLVSQPHGQKQFNEWLQVNWGLPIESLRDYLRSVGKIPPDAL